MRAAERIYLSHQGPRAGYPFQLRKINPNMLILVDIPGIKPRTANLKEIKDQDYDKLDQKLVENFISNLQS